MALRYTLPSLLIAAFCTFCNPCQAETAYTTKSAHLRTGPDMSYPAIAILSPGFRVDVVGCLNGYTWCDVIASDERGWVYAGNLAYPYQGREVPVLTYGAVIGIGVVGFVFFDYWHDHYRDRSWYRQRDRWVHPPHPAPRPPGRPPSPPPPRHPPPPPRHEEPRPPPYPPVMQPAPRPPPRQQPPAPPGVRPQPPGREIPRTPSK